VPEDEKHNAGVVRHLNDLVNAEAYDEMDDLFAPTYRDNNPGWKISSVADLKAVIASAHRSFGIQNEIEQMLTSGDKVFVRVNSKGRHMVPAFGVQLSGKETHLLIFEIYRFEQGKIAERWVLSDVIGLMEQLGVSIPAMAGR
jgi:predicted SnoaL-like aldol condensation-catalyzing enzyme